MSARCQRRVPRDASPSALAERLALREPARAPSGGAVVRVAARRAGRRRSGSRASPPRTARCRRIVDLAPAAGWDEREAPTSTASASTATSRSARSSTTTSTLAQLDRRRPRQRPVPDRGRPDPRRRDRVRPLPLPRRRRPDPPRRCSPLLQAPRARAGGRGTPLADGLRVRARACAACAVTNARRLRACVRGAARARADAELARARTVLLELERVWNHLNDIAAVCAGVGLAAGNNRFAALAERCAPAQRPAHRTPLPVRLASQVGGSALDLDDASRHRDARDDARRDPRPTRRAAGASSSSTRSFMDRLPDIGIVDAAAARALGAVGPAARAAGSPRTCARRARRLAYEGFEPAAPRRAAGDVAGAARAARSSSSCRPSTCSTRLLDRPLAPGGGRPRERRAGDRRRPRREPARRDLCIVERRRRPRRAAPPAHRLVRELARRRPRRRGQPPARLPSDQQELRALLRLRRPLMLTLLRDLRRLRRDDRASRARTAAAVARDPPRRCRLVQRLRARAHARLEPLLRPAALRARHRRLAPARRRPARHRPGHDPHARRAPDRLRRDARAAPRRRARRLRARLRRPRNRRANSSAPSRTCSPSTSASPAARPRPSRSPRR